MALIDQLQYLRRHNRWPWQDPGTLVGVTILFGFDIVVIPSVDSWMQHIQEQFFDVALLHLEVGD